MLTPDEIRAYARVAREERLSHLVVEGSDGTGCFSRVQFELAREPPGGPPIVTAATSPGLATPTSPSAGSVKDLDRCPCGHSVDIEHSTAGCLLGCSAETCLRTEAPLGG